MEKITGKDDLERVAYRENLSELNAYLKKRPVFVPQRPEKEMKPTNVTSADGGWRVLFAVVAHWPAAAEFCRSPAFGTKPRKEALK
jgi:hypothetical protein